MTRTAITGESNLGFHASEKVDLRLHQEPADLDQMGKLLWIQVFYLSSVRLFFSERLVATEGFHEPRMTVLHEGLLYPLHILTTETLKLLKHEFLAAKKLLIEHPTHEEAPLFS